MQKLRATRIVPFTAIAAFAALSVATPSFAQADVTIDDALSQSASGATIPLSKYTFSGSRGDYTGVLVGGDPFNPKPVTINAVLIPLIIQVVKPDLKTVVTFDPTAGDSCDGGAVPIFRFLFSPLALPAANLTFNGVNVGSTEYIDGFMKAEWWNKTGGSSSYSNYIDWAVANPVYFPLVALPPNGTVSDPGCSEGGEKGVISQDFFESIMTSLIIPSLQSTGVISPTKFAFFLTKSVTLSKTSGGIIGGKHYHTGSPVQTWAWAPYNNVFDVELASHEIGEWMNDPLGINSSPSWGYIGERKDECTSTFEVGDPLDGKAVVLQSVLSPYTYHVQELAFFSWFFDDKDATSVGAGGKFSSNGTFTGPSKPCLPGGTPGGTYVR